MAEKTLDLRGLKCPLPVLHTRRALSGLSADDVLIVSCSDPLAKIDIPTLVAQTGDALERAWSEAGVAVFQIRKC